MKKLFMLALVGCGYDPEQTSRQYPDAGPECVYVIAERTLNAQRAACLHWSGHNYVDESGVHAVYVCDQ